MVNKEEKPVEPRTIACLCGNTFVYIPKRGRPPVRCDDCREAYANGMIRDRLASLGVDPNLAVQHRIKSRPIPTPREPMILGEGEAESEEFPDISKSRAKVDRLEENLKRAGLHISQHRDKW